MSMILAQNFESGSSSIHTCVLLPIPHHHPMTVHTDEGQDEHGQCHAQVQPCHHTHECIAWQLRQDGLDSPYCPLRTKYSRNSMETRKRRWRMYREKWRMDLHW